VKNLLVIGYGVVGSSVEVALWDQYDVTVLDPPKDMPKDGVKDYDEYDGIIICVPTPANDDGSCDDSLVRSYMKEIRWSSFSVPVLLKSTTSIELIKELEHDPCLTMNPEFLTEMNATTEFQHQPFAIFGGNQGRMWYEMFIAGGITIEKVRFTDIVKAAYAKYAINCFLATKVVFFNELRMMYGDYNFDSLTDLIALDSRIGNSHMMVPGPDGKMGFAGACFPKDTKAFAHSGRIQGNGLSLLEQAIKINNEYRKV
jgi:UDPglucose 6-dehydrogenase